MFNTKPQQEAAQAQIAGLNQGYGLATGAVGGGQTRADTDYAAGLAPITTNLATSQAGTQSYADALGVNGPQGYTRAVQQFQLSPGFQGALDLGSQNVMRNKASTGQLASGATDVDLQNLGMTMENQQWQQYIQNLLPFMGAATTGAGQAGALKTSEAGTDVDLAKTLANLGWSLGTGTGAAQANADLAQTNVSGNILNAGMQGLKFATAALPFI